MSFILDALRKSEHERQRQTGPALAEVPVAQPKPRTNFWATAAIALLLVNLVVIGVLLLRKASREPVAAPVATAPAEAQAPPPVTSSPPAQVTLTRTAPAEAQPASAMPPMLQPAGASENVAQGSRNPLEDEVATPPATEPELVAQASAPPPGPSAVTRTPARGGNVVYEQLPDEATIGGPQYQASAPADRPAASPAGMPTADELAAAGGVPVLNLDLHVYSTNPAECLAFINGRKYRQGDTLQEGAVVRQITKDGVILEMNGRKFLLAHN
jgi:general secretion pathway protein B